MASIIGPRDGRKARRKRCDACVKRRIKCRDGIPCEYCKRMGIVCTAPIKPTIFTPVFVGDATHQSPDTKTSASLLTKRVIVPVPRAIGLKGMDLDVLYFFKSFLPMNVLTGNKLLIEVELLTMVRMSTTFRDTVQAVAIIHRTQQRQLMADGLNEKCEKVNALKAYDRSVRWMRDRVASNTLLEEPSALWITFLLGLFELMRDSTGTNWLSHFLHGTCTLLRLQHPESLASPGIFNQHRRAFFLSTRIFEIARSLIYSSPTFLSEPRWIMALAKLRENGSENLWHPKETLFDILPTVADLSIRGSRFCKQAEQYSIDTQCSFILSLANEGLLLQDSLRTWWVETTQWEASQDSGSKPDTELLIGYLYYNAISIYLSGTFDYHVQWTSPGAPCAPILHRSQIDLHVFEILRISQELLIEGVSGPLLFFPLRVAGARAADECTRGTILSLLSTTENRGFVVAKAFTIDLLGLWATRIITI